MPGRLNLTLRAVHLSLGRLPAGAAAPEWAVRGGFFSLTRTPEELSLVVETSLIPDPPPPGIKIELGWRCLSLAGPLAFDLVGIIHGLTGPLAEAHVPVVVLSTFETDHLLIKETDLARALAALGRAGHVIREEQSV